MTRSAMWVVKIGGSMAHSAGLVDWLETLARPRQVRLLVVPGGGPFADQVRTAQRQWGFDDAVAHRMALAAMDQYGLMLGGLSSRLHPAATRTEIVRAHRRGRVPVWLPSRMVEGRKDIPENWDVTSDSLAAWIAGIVGARRLVLVKSADPPPQSDTVAALRDGGLVDRALATFLERGAFDCWCVGAGRLDVMEHALRTGEGPGHHILGDR